MIQPNSHLLNIRRVSEHMGERSNYVCLDRNERVEPVAPAVFEEMLAGLSPDLFCMYPNPAPLYERLSRATGFPEDCIYLTNGSDAALRMIFQTYVRPDDLSVFPDPSYAMYAIYSQIFQARARTIAYSKDRRLDVAALINELEKKPRILVIANPDQPTGATLALADLRKLAAASLRHETLFIIDEAYYPFYPHTALDLVREFPNVIVTRTFSKAGGLAGLRLGYLVANAEVIQNIQRIRGAHEVNAMSVTLGSYILDHPELSADYLAKIEAGRAVLAEAARELNLEFPSCPANFQLLRFVGMTDTTPITQALKEKGYLVKGGFAAEAVRDCIRITLASPPIMRGFAKALRAVVAEMNAAV